MRYIFNMLLISVLLFASCKREQDTAVVFRVFHNQEWSRFDYIYGEFDVKDVATNYEVIMEVKVTENYPSPYENHQDDSRLLFNLTINNPEGGNFRSRNFQFNLKDKDGNWKAENKDGYYVFKLPLYEDMTFSDAGVHSFKIENKYPKDPLYGIEELTLKCVTK